jgi:integrase
MRSGLLRWRNVDFAGRVIRDFRNLPAHGIEGDPKSGKVRSVPLIDQAARALDQLSRSDTFTEPGDYVFVKEHGRALDDSELRKRFYAALTQAGLGHKRQEDPPLRFHDLRHTFGTLAVKVWDLRKVQGYMGHASITTTQLYMHHVPKHTDADDLTRLVETEVSAQPLAVT